MYKKILVPLDGSELAECVLEHVKDIARGCDTSEVALLFVAEPAPSGLYQSSAEVKEKLLSWGKKALARAEKILTAGDVKVKSHVLEGKAAETIVDYAVQNDIDLIIMATHGRSGPSRWALGSVAEKVTRSSTVPVLIAPPQECRRTG